MKLCLFSMMFTILLLSSCGFVTSVSSVKNSEIKKQLALETMMTAFGKDIAEKDEKDGIFYIKKDAAEQVDPIESRRAFYYYFLGVFHLDKARELQTNSYYEVSEEISAKAQKYFDRAVKITAEHHASEHKEKKKDTEEYRKKVTDKSAEEKPEEKSKKDVKPDEPEKDKEPE
ncbi:MAG: hypothetical protein R6W70_05325, partial [bacterium]